MARGSVASAVVFLSLAVAGRAAAQATGEIVEEEQQESSSSGSGSDDDDDDGGWDDDEESGPSESGGIHFGLRLAYGFPIGKLVGGGSAGTSGSGPSGDKLSDFSNGKIPIWVDLGWQASPSFMIGGYFSYGFVLLDSQIRDACDAANDDCSASDIRVGLQFQYSFSPGTSLDPWLGAGAGYEWLTLHQDDSRFQLHGWEFAFLQAGLDFGGDTGSSTYGPFVAYTFGQFSKAKFKSGGVDTSGDIDEKAMHSWLFVGIRGALK